MKTIIEIEKEIEELKKAKIFYLIFGFLAISIGIATINMPDDVKINFNVTDSFWVGIGWFIIVGGFVFLYGYLTLKKELKSKIEGRKTKQRGTNNG